MAAQASTASALLGSLENLPFSERRTRLSGLPPEQRKQLRALLDEATRAGTTGNAPSAFQSERLALLLQLGQLDPAPATPASTVAPARGRPVSGGAALVVLAAAVVIVAIVAMISGESGGGATLSSSTPVYPSAPSRTFAPTAPGTAYPSSPSPGYSQPPPSPYPTFGQASTDRDAMKSQIDADRARLGAMEAELQVLGAAVQRLEASLTSYKSQIDRYETNARLGLYVGSYAYQAALDDYNALAPQYNGKLQTYRSRYNDYEALLDRANALIRRYNASLGR